MPITAQQKAVAEATQHAAAHDPRTAVRLVAGPGTGKSSAIEERVRWLLASGLNPTRLFVVSFTRASALDLRLRIVKYCQDAAQPGGDQVNVSTLHSLALRALRRAGQLRAYPVEPRVLDDWETEKFFDREFGDHNRITSTRRQEEIRRHYEAYWSTGQFNPANYISPDPPISAAERTAFEAFHRPRTQLYACVLPGELIRTCMERVNAGTMDVRDVLGIEHFIADEFQDLNPLDQELIAHISRAGAGIFVAGDDDQSVYSFRFAAPSGIQTFDTLYAGCGDHRLDDCFRCTPEVLDSASALMQAHGGANRLPKNYRSLYLHSQPPVAGTMLRWRFNTDKAEATAVAESCSALIAAGVPANQIMILPTNYRAMRSLVAKSLEAAAVPYELSDEDRFIATPAGRLVYSLLRIVTSATDYVALRTVLGMRSGVGVKTCNQVSDAVLANNYNYRDLFYANPLPFPLPGRAMKAVTEAQAVVNALAGWQTADTLAARLAPIAAIVDSALGPSPMAEWLAFGTGLPAFMTLEEVLNVLAVESDEQRRVIFESAYQRANQALPVPPPVPLRVQVMTMHGAKGLSAQAVFIPGLEEQLLPGARRAPYPGLVQEAARLLYVSITRARAACMVSYAGRRFFNGASEIHVASQFANFLNGAFQRRTAPLSGPEAQAIAIDCAAL